MDIAIRQALAADIPGLVELMREFYGESGYDLDVSRAARSFEMLLADSTLGTGWVFLADSIAIGYVVLTVRFSMESGGLDACIDDLYVRPAHRRQGIARRGLEQLFAECVRRGILAVRVEVAAGDPPALSLYRSVGMQPDDDGRQVLRVELPRAKEA